jgi:hypothetical protein
MRGPSGEEAIPEVIPRVNYVIRRARTLHWVLDVTFGEDRSRIRKENAPENFGLLRRLALCLLKKETTSKRSIKGRRLRASWDEKYLRRVLCGNAGN